METGPQQQVLFNRLEEQRIKTVTLGFLTSGVSISSPYENFFCKYIHKFTHINYLSRGMRFSTMWYV